ncbi:polysaccharide deacetylase family protein [Natronococcus occultus]|uniref:Nicotinate-mononucleotide:5, 6-dimethylbenzimidazole phosphoribosyltransferase CobT n=1 Tax=Natronococcus occultus SP4 TaxID=694430 RepID=L0K0I6_9EURY|nr:polysaccharide deacetylase family protein [Natronococcus occultus]AGB38521.1 nicotinate-mononucleotide:5,6-dimethylbenzimidazole phosphoribosyltransferase CobT [Natronococcus occultus SP4]
MTDRSNTRRRFLALSGATMATGLAGCSDSDGSETDDDGTNETDDEADDPPADDTEDEDDDEPDEEEADADEYGPPELALETEYDSREEFGQPGEGFDDFEDADEWAVVQGSAEPDEEFAFEGSQSLRLAAEDGEDVIVEREIEPTDLSDRELSLAVRTTTPGNVAIDIRLEDAYGGATHHQLRAVSYGSDDVGWFRTNPGAFEEGTTPLERDAVERIQLLVYNTDDAEVWVDDLRIHDKPESGYVVLCWDDGTPDFYERASPLHDEYDVNAVQSAVRQWTQGSRDDVLTLDQLQERQEAGDQIIAHGSHVFLEDLEEDQLRESLERDKQWAVDNELQGGHYITYPHNSFDQTVLDVVSDYYYAGGFNQAGDVNLTGVYGFDPLVLPRTIGHDLDIAKRCVDLAAAHRQCTILNFHAFDLENTMAEDEYEELLQYIDSEDGVEVIDFDDLWTMRREGH